MAQTVDIDRWRKGKDHWNKWANKLLAKKSDLQSRRQWLLPKGGKSQNTATTNWLEDASVDFSGHHFDVGTDFKEIIFPFIDIVESDGLLPQEFPLNVVVNFKGANFKGANLKEANFSKMNLIGFDFEDADLEGVLLEHTVLHHTIFRNSNMNVVLFSGAEISGCKFERALLEVADFSNVTELNNCLFNNANLTDANFNSTILNGCSFEQATLERARFVGSEISKPKFSKTNCSKANFTGANLAEAEFNYAVLNEAIFDQTNLNTAKFQEAELNNSSFQGAKLEESFFYHADLTRADCRNATLGGANFTAAVLSSAIMLGSSFDKNTKFDQDPKVENLAVDRYALECLENFGGLSVGARMSLDIHDDVATLRADYSGYKQWLHLFAFAGFVFPYLWFIAKQWGIAKFLPDSTENVIPLWQALFRFIYGGGESWEHGATLSWSFGFFLIALLYNVLKAFLLDKTKRLELTQESSGLPARFSLNDKIFPKIEYLTWRNVFNTARYGFYFYFVIVLFNLAHFFSMVVPISPN